MRSLELVEMFGYFVIMLASILVACTPGRGEPAREQATSAEQSRGDLEADGCEAGFVVCDGICVDLSGSAEHCGACGVFCFEGQDCVDGACVGVGVLSPSQLRQALTEKSFLLLNVREPPVGIIPGTDASVSDEKPEQLVDAIGPDLHARVVVYCRTNPRSLRAIKALGDMGYTNVSYLRGGVMAWVHAGYDLEQ